MDFISQLGLAKFLRSRAGFVLTLGAATGLYILLRNSSISWESVLPYLFLGGCLLMHLFMPHGHGGGRHKDGDSKKD